MPSLLENKRVTAVMVELMVPAIMAYYPEKYGDKPPPEFDVRAYIASSSAAHGMGVPPSPCENAQEGAAGASSGQPKVNAAFVLSWINSPRGANLVSVGSALLGMDPVIFKRIWKKCWLNPENPEMVAAVHSALQNDDEFEIKWLLAQLLTQEIINYSVEQSTTGYAGGGGADASSTSAPPPESSDQYGENSSMIFNLNEGL